MTSMSGISFKQSKQDTLGWGRLAECAVGAHLFTSAVEQGMELFYWREGNYEVDYVLHKGRELAAIEIKSGWRKIQASGLEQFSRRYQCRKVLIGGSGIPIEEALKMEAESFL